MGFSMIWKFLERASTQIINLVIQVLLARLIVPEDFGALAVLLSFVNVGNIFVQKGFSSSLIRKEQADQWDYDTVFTVSLGAATIFYTILFVSAPWIAEIYGMPALRTGLRVIALQLPLSSVYCVQNAILVREGRFRSIFMRGVISTALSGALGVVMAYSGYGLWTLVVQSLANMALLCVTAWKPSHWRPRMAFDRERFCEVFSFGKNVLITDFLLTTLDSVRTTIIGKVYNPVQLSYYDRGQTYPATLMRAVIDTLFSVLLPFFSKMSDDFDGMRRKTGEVMVLVVAAVFPMFFGMAAISEELIVLLLTERWIQAVPYMQLLCVYQALYPYQTISKVILYAVGDSKRVLHMETVQALVAYALMGAALFFGPIWVAVSLIAARLIGNAVYMMGVNRKIGTCHFLKTTWKPAAASMVMAACLIPLNELHCALVLRMLLKIGAGAAVYAAMMLLLDGQKIRALWAQLRTRKCEG